MGKDEGNGFASLNSELPNRSQVFAVECGGSSQHEALRSRYGVDPAIVEPIYPWEGRAKIETDHKLGAKINTA